MKASKAKAEIDWTNHTKTTWTEGIEEVLWDSEISAAIVLHKSGEVTTWKENEWCSDGTALRAWLGEGFVDLETPDDWKDISDRRTAHRTNKDI